ncbi:MAG: DUF294 nucleotidyltransferase-like domain-containing protein [Rhodocyclaceae bacterium]|nr:DUF294 nucleotidyltransferase-like domain-containing protein [Rhodocyclaceae bacterium]
MTYATELAFPCKKLASTEVALKALADLSAAPALARQLSDFSHQLARSGLDGEAAPRIISLLNDRLTARIIELTAKKHRLPPGAWCWLALGSEGRHEQTFVTDQDNSLIFSAVDGEEANALRELFLPFAREVNQHLAACGFKLCSGNIMAGNPAWCLSLDEWKTQFIDWVRRPEPTALLNASIFFDLRPLYGDPALAEDLRTLLLAMTTDTPAFLHLMAANAIQAEVPLSFLGEVSDGGKSGDGIDLKKYGSRIFVDAARIFALAHGARSVNTTERLREAGAASGLTTDELLAVNAAFAHILRLRLEHQLNEIAEGGEVGHGIRMAVLHDLDKAILRESLKQARRLQQRLKLNYAL